jgi:UDP-GlcNAc:undecaprenyl-phosphate GlcNAc-1-phosphate transferase
VFIGAVLGFLVFNFPRASIFMGDGGSFTIGFALAALNLTSGQAYSKTVFSIFVFPVLVLALPLFDTTFVSVVRYFSGRAISQGGRDHTSHRLVAIGLSETTAVVTLWTISAAGALTALILYNAGFSYALFSGAIVILGLALFGIVLSRVRVYAEGAEPDGPASAFGFTLPGELVYKRQILWVLLDAVTVVLAINAALELMRVAAAAAATVLPAAGVMIALLGVGLYRWDWVQFGMPITWRVGAGAAGGLLAGAVADYATSTTPVWSPASLATAWLLVAASVCGTGMAIRALDRWLHQWGGVRG